VVENGIKAGESQVTVTTAPFTGGNAIGGQLQGTFYIFEPPPFNSYQNIGEFTATVGTNVQANFNTFATAFPGATTLTPGFQNTLTFAPPAVTGNVINTHGAGDGGVPISLLLGKASGSQRAFFSELSGLTAHSVSLGQQIGINRAIASASPFSGGALSGGIFFGTVYRNSLGNPTFISYTFNTAPPSAIYAFAFGNNPFNNPAPGFPLITIPPAPSMITFANGLTKTITSGQILFPMFSTTPFQNGSVLTFGANPANSSIVNSILTNTNSFLFF